MTPDTGRPIGETAGLPPDAGSPASASLAADAAGPATAWLPADLDGSIVLLRHGESQWITEGRFQGQGDSRLSELGRRQAALTADRLAHPHDRPALPIPSGPPVEIRHSPLARTSETATAVAAAMADPSAFGRVPSLVPDPGLLEIGQGAWEGLLGSTIAERWGETLEAWRTDPLTAWAPGGESLPAVDVRVRASLASVVHALRAAPAAAVPRSQVLGYHDAPGAEPWSLIVGHDGVFKVVLLALLDLPLASFWSFPFAMCGITIVELRRGRARLRLHNAADHLAPLATAVDEARDLERRRAGAL